MKKILFIDDEPDLHTIMRFNLKEAGFNMDSALSAEEALNMDLGSYNLILL
ncbi:MAG: DNA-binding response regulator, partial [Spirochaetes bacterium]